MSRRGSTKPRANTPADKEIGLRIRGIRIDQDMSQELLARSLGVSFQQVQKYEKGTNRISASRLIEVAHALKTTPHNLIGWDTPKMIASGFDYEAYKLAKAFLRLRDPLRKPIRAMIETLIGENDD